MAVNRYRFYIGPLGNVLALPPLPKGANPDATPTRLGGVHSSLSGRTFQDNFGVKRNWNLSWSRLREDDFTRLVAYHRKNVLAPLRFVDLRHRNLLEHDISVCGNFQRDTSSFTASVGTLALNVYSLNLAGNPSFETLTTGWKGTNASSISQVQGGVDGQYSLEVKSTTTATATGFQSVSALPGVVGSSNYKFTVSVNPQSAALSASGLDVNWYDASLAFISSTSVSAGGATQGVWTHLTGTHAAPSNARYAQVTVNFGTQTVNNRIRADRVVFATTAATAIPTELQGRLDGELVWSGATTSGTLFGVREAVPVITGSTYLLSAYVGGSGSVKLRVQPYDVTGAPMTSTLGSTVTLASGYVRSSLSYTPAAGAVAFRFGLEAQGASTVNTMAWQAQIDETLKDWLPGIGAPEVLVTALTDSYPRYPYEAVSAIIQEV